MTVRTRFAPSPTGYLHVGSVRTALFSWLYARHCGGQFILRIEDTDLERSTKESVDVILAGMAWLGIDYDEGPYYQTQHFDRYHEVIDQLQRDGHAYRCYCSKERLEDLRGTQMANKEKPRYDGHCRDLAIHSDEPHVIRFRNPTSGKVVFEDKIRGEVSVENGELDDLIIARTDGMPTYNLSVVVDDWDMKITHVIRGDDHVNNTPRQINILKALGASLPIYAHVPMILGGDGKRLSKRHGAVSVMEYKAEGFLPEALLNYLVRLGWSHGDQEIFSRDEMIKLFDLTHMTHSPAAFSQDKLLWLNQHYLKTLPASSVAEALQDQITGIDVSSGPPLAGVVEAQCERVKTLKELAERSLYFYQDITEFEGKAVKKNLKLEAVPLLTAVIAQLEALSEWTPETITAVMHAVAEQFQTQLGKLAQPMRVSVTGGAVSPPLGQTLGLLGKKTSLQRLRHGLGMCSQAVE